MLLVSRLKGHPGSLHVGGRDAAAAAETDHCRKPAFNAALQMRKCVDTRSTYSLAGLRQTEGGNTLVSVDFWHSMLLSVCLELVPALVSIFFTLDFFPFNVAISRFRVSFNLGVNLFHTRFLPFSVVIRRFRVSSNLGIDFFVLFCLFFLQTRSSIKCCQ